MGRTGVALGVHLPPEQLAAPEVAWWSPSESLLHEHRLPAPSES